jgi:hypothetical protein
VVRGMGTPLAGGWAALSRDHRPPEVTMIEPSGAGLPLVPAFVIDLFAFGRLLHSFSKAPHGSMSTSLLGAATFSTARPPGSPPDKLGCRYSPSRVS